MKRDDLIGGAIVITALVLGIWGEWIIPEVIRWIG